jgi:hypothetical protein
LHFHICIGRCLGLGDTKITITKKLIKKNKQVKNKTKQTNPSQSMLFYSLSDKNPVDTHRL